MTTYHKINAPFKRDGAGKPKHDTVSRPEFAQLRAATWHGWEKLDGMNIRIICEDGEVRYAGKTDRAVLSQGLIDHLDKEWKWVAEFIFGCCNGADFTLYGEGLGPKIQNGGGYSKSPIFVPFDLRYHENEVWEDRFVLQETIERELERPFASYLGQHSLAVWEDFARDRVFLETAVPGADSMKTSEGYILIPEGDLLNRRGERIITKVKFCDY